MDQTSIWPDFNAPMIAPTLGGFLVDAFGWRGNVAATVVFAGVLLALVVFSLPETHQKHGKGSFGIGSMMANCGCE